MIRDSFVKIHPTAATSIGTSIISDSQEFVVEPQRQKAVQQQNNQPAKLEDADEQENGDEDDIDEELARDGETQIPAIQQLNVSKASKQEVGDSSHSSSTESKKRVRKRRNQ